VPPRPAAPPLRPRKASLAHVLPTALLVLIVAGAALAYLRPWQSRAPAGGAVADGAAPGTLRRQAEGDSLPRHEEGEALPGPSAEPEFGTGTPLPAAGREKGAFELAEVALPPRPLNLPELRSFLEASYPPHLRDSGVQGTVQLRFRIDREGRVDGSSVQVTVSSDPEFDAVAIRGVQLLRFSPAQVAGQPVPVWAELPIQFQVSW